MNDRETERRTDRWTGRRTDEPRKQQLGAEPSKQWAGTTKRRPLDIHTREARGCLPLDPSVPFSTTYPQRRQVNNALRLSWTQSKTSAIGVSESVCGTALGVRLSRSGCGQHLCGKQRIFHAADKIVHRKLVRYFLFFLPYRFVEKLSRCIPCRVGYYVL